MADITKIKLPDGSTYNVKDTISGYTTQVKVGTTAYNPSSGVISLPAYPTSLPASNTTSTYSATGTNPVNGTAVASALGTLDVTGASGIAASKTISAWSETDGKVSITTQDIAIANTQVSGLGTASTKDVPASGNASTTQVVLGSDTRLSNARTPTSHTHGNIQNGGTLQTNDVAIANGDKLVVTDASDSNKVARTSVAFDGSTATKALTQKGTWETFSNNAGTVTSVTIKGTSPISVDSESAITTSGTRTISLGTVPISKGGTGATTALGATDALGVFNFGQLGTALVAGDDVDTLEAGKTYYSSSSSVSPTLAGTVPTTASGFKIITYKNYISPKYDMQFATAVGYLFYRAKYSDGSSYPWGNWYYLYHSGNLISQTAASGGTTNSLVTTGEKYSWNNKVNRSGDTLSGSLTFTNTDSANIVVSGRAMSYINKDGNAAVFAKKTKNATQWYPVVCEETYGGGHWQIGNYNNEYLQFVYATATNRSNNTNKTQIYELKTIASDNESHTAFLSWYTTTPTSGNVLIADGTNGGLKSSSYTIAASVPSGAVFTDTTYSLSRDGEHIKLTPSSGTAQTVGLSNLINGLTEGASQAQADDYLVAQYAGGGTTTTSYHRRPVKNIVNATNVKAALGTGSGTSKYLREDGSWQTPPNTTYTFANGTNGFTVTPSGGTAQTVTVTPSITNNITGSGTRTSGYIAKFSGTNTITNGPQLGSATTTYLRNDGSWATPTDNTKLPLGGGTMTGNLLLKGCSLYVRNSSSSTRALLWIGSNDDGVLTLYKTDGTVGINLESATGKVSCSDIVMSPTTPTVTLTKSSGVWTAGTVTCKKWGRLVQLMVQVKGAGTQVAAGTDGFVGKISGVAFPAVDMTLIGYTGSTMLMGWLDGSGNISIRASALTQVASGNGLYVTGTYLCK